ncbi:MAG: hypothetical protein JST86_09245 [Bacteroidetes bacterium]|nr:hypothetical protein [Bacteroidota bacterium]
MKKLKQLRWIFALILVHSCSNSGKFDSQIKLDLSGMLQNKVDVEQVSVTNVTDFDAKTQKVTFDCKLHFTDNLYKDDGILAFKKGMKVTEKNNVFYYFVAGKQLKLIKLEFGKSSEISDFEH